MQFLVTEPYIDCGVSAVMRMDLSKIPPYDSKTMLFHSRHFWNCDVKSRDF